VSSDTNSTTHASSNRRANIRTALGALLVVGVATLALVAISRPDADDIRIGHTVGTHQYGGITEPHLVRRDAYSTPLVTIKTVKLSKTTAVASANPALKAMEAALSKLGSPYRYGAAGPSAFDCSGLMKWSFAQAGIVLPRTSRAQSTVGTPVSKANLQPGDLVFFYSPVSHVAMYIGGGKVVHASTSSSPVKISNLSAMPFHNARRV
jgi:cell wall-associated NlpC family hydrolase